MKLFSRTLASAALALSVASCGAASSPQELAKTLQAVLDSGDLDAASELANLDGSPAIWHKMILDLVVECSSASICKVAVAPMDDEYRQFVDEQTEKLGIEIPTAEGLLVVESETTEGASLGSFKFPYSKVGGGYGISSGRLSNSQMVKLRATTNEMLLQEMFAEGVQNPVTGEIRHDWATAASRLPEGGGPAGQSLVGETTTMHEAVLAKNPEAAIPVGGPYIEMLIGETDYYGKSIPMEVRKRRLHVLSLTRLHDVKVLDGYSLDELVILVIEARDGIGWVVRGPILMMDAGRGWGIAYRNLVEYPAEG